ncbi:hypothetical protein [Altibacter sp.]|uniref:hypothetical protein n=1 Tax=Altibacter sp. TaxID=2024823 RepID=UPI0025C08838|nr:hypothetical protein [Altibacter sp.]
MKKTGKASNRLLKQVKEEDQLGAFAKAKARAFQQRRNLLAQESAYMICGISGDPGTGKTGLALDCRTDEERETHWVFVLDFDEGAEPTWRQHWSSDDKVFIYNPHVYKDDMTIDYMATADMARFFIGMVKEAIETNKISFDDEEEIEVKAVKAIVFDGLDTWLDTTNMIARLNHIKGNDPRQADKVKMVPTQWFARTQEYQRLFKAACQLECHKFFITHMKEVHDGFEVVGQKPDWEKSTTAKLYQHVITSREERNGKTSLYAKVTKSKTNAENEGQSFLLFENVKGKVSWNGLEAIKDNTL